jgi:hypothetical protein
MVSLADSKALTAEAASFIWVAAAVLLLGLGLRVWLGQEGAGAREQKATTWLGRWVIGGLILVLAVLFYLVFR